jgi:hypothetical protein
MTPWEVDELSDADFAAMLRLMHDEAAAIKAASAPKNVSRS